MELSFRTSTLSDGFFLVRWLADPEILQYFPMSNIQEIENAVYAWLDYAKYGAALTVEKEGEVCGMANLYLQPYKKFAHQCLFAIVVGKEYRGCGIGRALLSQLIDLARTRFNIEILHLEVYETNPAIHLYRKMGFTECGKQSHFIKEDGKYMGKILMEKRIEERNSHGGS